ncbi:MAG: peptidase M16 [Cyanobium sp. NAT70]|nr:peptidase M16 [Cyanobium sp. NAT70]|tara:strand:- start:19856 stop:21127 length:1272 start_codon:yes stop_codon:yes gene_type:complete
MGGPELLLEPINTPGVLSAKLLLEGGSAQDAHGSRGSHQLLASLMTRGCGPHDHLQLADLVEGRGAGLRCEAHEDGLLISLRCASDDATDLLPLLAWMVVDAHLRPEQLTLERGLSIQALQRQREDPFQIAVDGWRQLAYGNGGYGHDPLGVEEDLRALSLDQLRTLADGLTSRPSVLAIAGVWPSSLDAALPFLPGFQDWNAATDQQSQKQTTSQASVCSSPQRSDQTLITQPIATEQVVVMLGQATLSHGHPDDLALRLLQCHLGMGMSSLLFRRLREEHGVAYDVGLHHPSRAGSAPFIMHASTGSERADITLQLLAQSWWELASSPLSDEDLSLAKSKFIGQMAHAQQTSSQRAERRVQLRGLGLADDHDQRCLQDLEDLGAADLKRVAAEHLSRPCLSLCGPQSKLDDLSRAWASELS